MRPYGRRVWKNIPFQKYYFVSDISCQQLGEEYNFEGFCAPLRAQGLKIYNFKNIILYRIYHANKEEYNFEGLCAPLRAQGLELQLNPAHLHVSKTPR